MIYQTKRLVLKLLKNTREEYLMLDAIIMGYSEKSILKGVVHLSGQNFVMCNFRIY